MIVAEDEVQAVKSEPGFETDIRVFADTDATDRSLAVRSAEMMLEFDLDGAASAVAGSDRCFQAHSP